MIMVIKMGIAKSVSAIRVVVAKNVGLGWLFYY